MKIHVETRLILAVAAGLVLGMPTSAAPTASTDAFTFERTARNVTADPDGIWTGHDLAPNGQGTVTIHEYRLATSRGAWLVSQIWNADCSSDTCPTRLVWIAADGRRKVVADDMMHQVVPPGDPRFAGAPGSKAEAAYAEHPFRLGPDGTTLINGDFTFPLAEARP